MAFGLDLRGRVSLNTELTLGTVVRAVCKLIGTILRSQSDTNCRFCKIVSFKMLLLN